MHFLQTRLMLLASLGQLPRALGFLASSFQDPVATSRDAAGGIGIGQSRDLQRKLRCGQLRPAAGDDDFPPGPVSREGFNQRLSGTPQLTYFDKQVLHYDAEAVTSPRVFALLLTSACIFWKPRVRHGMLLTFLTTFLVFVAIRFMPFSVPGPAELSIVVTLVNAFHQLLSWLLGFFVSTALARWWTVRNNGIGALWGATSDLTMMISGFYPQDTPAHKEVRDRVLRWGVLSHELLYREVNGIKDLSSLRDNGLLLPEEESALQGALSKPQVVWMWMASYFNHLAYGKGNLGASLPFAAQNLRSLHSLCRQGRGAVGMAVALTDTQIPFAYAHLLGLLVWVHNLAQACTSAFILWQTSTMGDYYRLGAELIYLVVYPLMMLGLLHIGVGMMNPLRSQGGLDFPQGAYSYFMLAENGSFQEALIRPPYGAPAVWESSKPQ